MRAPETWHATHAWISSPYEHVATRSQCRRNEEVSDGARRTVRISVTCGFESKSVHGEKREFQNFSGNALADGCSPVPGASHHCVLIHDHRSGELLQLLSRARTVAFQGWLLQSLRSLSRAYSRRREGSEFPSSNSQPSPSQEPCQHVCFVNLSSLRGFVEPFAQYALPVFLMPPLGVESLSSASQCCHTDPHRLTVRLFSLLPSLCQEVSHLRASSRGPLICVSWCC